MPLVEMNVLRKQEQNKEEENFKCPQFLKLSEQSKNVQSLNQNQRRSNGCHNL